MTTANRYFVNEMVCSEEPDTEDELGKCELQAKKCDEISSVVREKQGRDMVDGRGGPYCGIAGPAFMCYYLSRFPQFSNKKDELLTDALELITIALRYANEAGTSRTDEAAYLLGNGGIVVVAALIYDAKSMIQQRDEMIKRYKAAANICQPLSFLSCGGDELLVGRAGYLCGCIMLNKFIDGNPIPKDIMATICKSIIISGQKYSQHFNSPSSLMYSYYQIEYLGAGHGLSGILQMLLAVPECLDNDPQAESEVKASIDFLVSLQTATGNFPTALDELGRFARAEEDELVHWCHGAPGVIYLLARAYLRWKEPQYLDACKKCCDVIWQRGLLKKGPGICHGVSGSGYAFLLMYKLTGEKIYLCQARKFADFMHEPEFQKSARTPDCLYSLYEGLAGTACFLVDLINPSTAHFPLYDDIEIVSEK